MRKLKLSHRILIAMFALIFFSFITVGLVTIIRYQSKNKSYHKERLQRKDRAVVESIRFMTEEKTTLFNRFENLADISTIHKLNLRIFSLQGKLILSSEKGAGGVYVINQSNLGETMDPPTYQALTKKISKKENNIREIYDNNEGELEIYTVLYNEKNEPYGILNIPYKNDLKNINDEIRDEVMVLLSIYIFLFFISAVMAIVLLKQITHPLKIITKKLKSIDIKQKNEKIHWPVKDEIGMLINQYNQLLIELKNKAEELAKSERKSAWKNMAKQIAHEIKNPLTPMRLSVQQFERVITRENPTLKERVASFSNTLIQQIDTMNAVVSSFSNFASISEEKKEEFLLEDEVERVLALYKEGGIKLKKPKMTCWVNIDKTHLTRVLNNIIKNAIESIDPQKERKIKISIENKKEFWELTIKDNGAGIPVELRNKIFEPKFTTKNSGMGLGLAMVKNLVDDFGGKINFISKLKNGTTFYIKIPKHEKRK